MLFLILLRIANLVLGQTFLQPVDFTNGTYVITTPGTYTLNSDIHFNPRTAQQLGVDAYSASFPSPQQLASEYDAKAFGLGFFAAIVVASDNVEIDLGGHRLEQSAEHALLQRFFSLIEVADRPFVPGQGPSNFGMSFRPAQHVRIHNGVLGRSSHHAVHGNGNVDVVIENIIFQDYEVAAVALNGVTGLIVRNCVASNRKDVPVLGTFSAAIFIRPFVEYLYTNNVSTTLNLLSGALTVFSVRNSLKTAINAVHADILLTGKINAETHPEEYGLFHNKLGVLDGNSYGFLTNSFGVAVNGFPDVPSLGFDLPSRDVLFENITIFNNTASINEIVSLKSGSGVANDPVGAVLQLKNLHPHTQQPLTVSSSSDSDAEYTGNVVANAQLLVAKAFLEGQFSSSGLDLSRNSITQNVLDWAEAVTNSAQAKLSNLVSLQNGWVCNGDSMFHVNKGVIGFKIDATQNVTLRNVNILHLENLGAAGSTLCGDYSQSKSHPLATLHGYGGAITRGVTFSGTTNAQLEGFKLHDAVSRNDISVGVDVFTGSSHVTTSISDVSATVGYRFATDTHQLIWKNSDCFKSMHCIDDKSLVGVKSCE